MGMETLEIEILQRGEEQVHHLRIIKMKGVLIVMSLEEIPIEQSHAVLRLEALGKAFQLRRGIRQMLENIQTGQAVKYFWQLSGLKIPQAGELVAEA